MQQELKKDWPGIICSVEDIYEAGSRVHLGKEPEMFRSMFSRMLSTLRERWMGSIVRTVVGELYRFPLRIRATLGRPTRRSRVAIPGDPRVNSDSFLLNRSFALACSDHILRQCALRPWLGSLDMEILGISFRMGAEWAFRNQGKPACSEEFQRTYAVIGASASADSQLSRPDAPLSSSRC
jgi:hypothetical protein